jgi:type II secretory pathway pseudopilin PulG
VSEVTMNRPERAPAPPSPARPCRAAGFTLIEALVSLAIMIVVLLGLLALLEFNSRVARAQVNVSEMQQSLRVVQADMVRTVRMAGRGGLPAFRPATAVPVYAGMFLPQGPSLGVDNNVAAGTKIGGAIEAEVVAGTDVLTVRGVLNSTFYQVNPSGDGQVSNTGTGSITVRSTSPTGVPQDLQALEDAIDLGRPEALLLVGYADDRTQVVVELTGGTSSSDSVVLNFTTSGTHGADYLKLSPGGAFPPELISVGAVGLLEEYRYYVRDVEGTPRLSRARLYPGTDIAYANDDSNLEVDLADNILDLQLALGIDRNSNETIEDTTDAADDWLFNAEGDSPEPEIDWNAAARPLYYLRVTTLARTDRIDPRYVSPPIEAIEDHVYSEPDAPPDDAARLARGHRRRLLSTVVDLRNLS